MKKQYLLLTSLALLLGVVGCGETTSSINTSNPDNGSSNVDVSSTPSDTNSSTPTPSIPQDEEYVIIARTYIGINITPSKNKAKKGETITLTISLDVGYSLKKLYLNGSENGLTKVNDTTYTFVMPNNSAVITAELSVEGDVTIQGTIATPLVLDETTGIYVAKNVEIVDTAYLSYFVNGQELSVIQIDNTKCFADLDLNYGNGTQGAFSIAGNAKYNFYYDPNNGDVPCYVVRTEVLKAPDSKTSFQSLFSGRVKSEPTTYPQNVLAINYSNGATGDEYKWTNYESGSLAVSKITDANKNVKTSYVYKSIKDDVYTVVDNYIEGSKGTNDQTRLDDSSAYSGKYNIVDAVESNYSKYQRTAHDAEFDAHHYSHDIHSLDFDIHYGYRTGFDSTWDDTLIDYDVSVSSVDNIDGGFTTTVSSFKTFDETLDVTTAGSKKYHITYDIEITFTKAGAPVSGSYVETYYSSDAYDISNGVFYPNGETMGSVTKSMNFTYTYGNKKTTPINFDTSPYFITELNDLTINNPSTLKSGDFVQQNDIVNDYVSFNAYPETALDAWQYGIISSDNHAVVGPKSNNEPLKYVANASGDVQITIGNHSTNHLTRTVNLNVINSYEVDGFYLTAYNAYYDEEILAVEAYVNGGYTKKAVIVPTSRNTGKYVTGFDCGDITVISSKPEVLTATVERVNSQYVITFDATKATNTETVNVSITVICNSLEDGYAGQIMTVHVLPNSKPTQSLIGNWSDASDYPDNPVEVTLNNYVSGDDSTFSTLKLDGKTYKFKFTYDDQTNKYSASAYYNGGLDYIELVYDPTTDQIGLFAVSASTWNGQDDITSGEIILGSCSAYDEEYNDYTVATYYFLDRVN